MAESESRSDDVAGGSDEQIGKDVVEALRWDARVQPSDIGVVVKAGIATLSGWVDSFFKRWAGEDVAQSVRGVRAVANEIEVRLSSFAEATDADLAQAAERVLEQAAGVPGGRVTLSIARGWVTLQGEVNNLAQKEAAERALRQLAGVRGLSNTIVVVPRPIRPPKPKSAHHGA